MINRMGAEMDLDNLKLNSCTYNLNGFEFISYLYICMFEKNMLPN
jgi:hypothetical protein